jgi:hypothetical protein
VGSPRFIPDCIRRRVGGSGDMKPRKRLSRYLIFFLGALVGAAVFVLQHRPPSAPRELAFWYWHTPFRISNEDAMSLERMGTDRLFVLAATISNSESGPTAILNQEWKGASRLPLSLTIPFDRGILVHFEDLDLANLATLVVDTFRHHRSAAEKAGNQVSGLQLDFDCPTRLLPRYASLLRMIRAELPKESQLSIAALATWLGATSFREVLKSLDFYCPQFYEGEMPSNIEEFKPVATIPNIEQGIGRAESLGRPYFVGLPAYGHALMFDGAGKLAGTLRGLAPSQAARRPNLRWARTDALDKAGAVSSFEKGIGLDLSVFESADGSKAAFELPSARFVRTLAAAARRKAGASCLGVALFRFPEPGEELSVPVSALESALRGKKAPAELRAQWRARTSPWAAIESGEGRGSLVSELILEIENVGRGATRFEPSGVEISVEAARQDLESAEPGDAGPHVLRLDAAGVRTLVFRLPRLAPLASAEIGPIRVFMREGVSIRAKISWHDGENPQRRTLELPEWKPKQ